MKLVSLLLEAIKKDHFVKRINDRLKSEYTTFPSEKQDIQNEVFELIDLLEKINFNSQQNIGIHIYKSATWYKYEKVVDGKLEKSEGNNIWAVIRGNELGTLVFGNNQYVPQNIQVNVTIGKLIGFINNVKKGNSDLSQKEITYLNSNYNADKVGVEPVIKQEPFIIQAVKWELSPDKLYLVKKNNPTHQIPVDDAMKLLSDIEQERLLSLL